MATWHLIICYKLYLFSLASACFFFLIVIYCSCFKRFIFYWKCKSYFWRERNSFDMLAYLLTGCDSWTWVGPKQGTRIFFQVSHTRTESKGFVQSSTAFPGLKPGVGQEVEQLRHKSASIVNCSICNLRDSVRMPYLFKSSNKDW